MKLSFAAIALFLGLATAVPADVRKSHVQGFDISSHQGNVNFKKAHCSGGTQFVIIKATEGTGYISETHKKQWNDAGKQKLIRGAYHFARPNKSSAKKQAKYFIKHGGDWKANGRTLPGMLDYEANPYDGGKCYGLNKEESIKWVQEFVDTYKAEVGRVPMLFFSHDVWRECFGNTEHFKDQAPMALSEWGERPPKVLPGGWDKYTFWQYTDSYKYGGDGQLFNGNREELVKFADNK